jgi:hypothetical protein
MGLTACIATKVNLEFNDHPFKKADTLLLVAYSADVHLKYSSLLWHVLATELMRSLCTHNSICGTTAQPSLQL